MQRVETFIENYLKKQIPLKINSQYIYLESISTFRYTLEAHIYKT